MPRETAAQKAAREKRAAAEQAVTEAQAKADSPDATAEDQEALDKARAELAALPPADAPPAQVAPQQYENAGWGVGQAAPGARYGIVQPDGSVKLTGSKGANAPKAGERGTIIVHKGDTVTRSIRAALGITD